MYTASYVPGVGGEIIAVYSRLRSLKFAYVSSGSHDLAGAGLSGFLFSFFSPPISPGFFLFPHSYLPS